MTSPGKGALIVDAIRQGTDRPADIARLLDMNPSTVHTHVSVLARKGVITRTAMGRYALSNQTPPPNGRSRRQPVRDEIVNAVGRGLETPKQVADALGKNKGTVATLMTHAVRDGQLVKTRVGHYRVPGDFVHRETASTPRRKRKTRDRHMRERIVATVAAGHTNLGDIAREVGRKPNGLSGTLSQLIKTGLIVRTGLGEYALGAAAPEAGKTPDNGLESVTRTIRRRLDADQRIADALTLLAPGRNLDMRILMQWIDLTREMIG